MPIQQHNTYYGHAMTPQYWPSHSYPPAPLMHPGNGQYAPPQTGYMPPQTPGIPPFGMPNALMNGQHPSVPPPIPTTNTPAHPEPPTSPIFPSACVTPNLPPHVNSDEVRAGVGCITWLSTQAGLIGSEEFGTVSFQLKSFCDQQVSDLTSVLRPGYKLKFKATPSSTGDNTWNATFVVPVQGTESQIYGDITAEIERFANKDTGPPQLARDPYDLALEARAIPMLLGIFERQQSANVQLSAFHCHISNCSGQDEPLYRYVGTSSLKRRQFLERRTHLFNIDKNDVVSLQPSAIYVTVFSLHKFLLSHGGACLLQEIWEFFNNSPGLPVEARDAIGEGKRAFLAFLNTHEWIMSVFPSKVFVSVRRQLPDYEYQTFINTHFAEHDVRSTTSPSNSSRERKTVGNIPKAASVTATVRSAQSMDSSVPWTRRPFDNDGSPAWQQRPGTGNSNGSPPTAIESMSGGSYWQRAIPRQDSQSQMQWTPQLLQQALAIYRQSSLVSTGTQTESPGVVPPKNIWTSYPPNGVAPQSIVPTSIVTNQARRSGAQRSALPQSPLDDILRDMPNSMQLGGMLGGSIWSPTVAEPSTYTFCGLDPTPCGNNNGQSKAPGPPQSDYDLFSSSPLFHQGGFNQASS